MIGVFVMDCLVTHVEHWLHKLFIKLKWCDVGMAKIFVIAVLVYFQSNVAGGVPKHIEQI